MSECTHPATGFRWFYALPVVCGVSSPLLERRMYGDACQRVDARMTVATLLSRTSYFAYWRISKLIYTVAVSPLR